MNLFAMTGYSTVALLLSLLAMFLCPNAPTRGERVALFIGSIALEILGIFGLLYVLWKVYG